MGPPEEPPAHDGGATGRFARFSRTDFLRSNLKRKSIRGALFMASGNALDVLFRTLAIAILARLLGPEDFGLLAMVTAVSGMLDGLRDFGLSSATVQRPHITHRQVTNLFWVNVVVGAVLALALSAASPFLAMFYQDERVLPIAIVLSQVFIWNGLTVQHEALLTRQLRQGELAVIRLTASLISIVIAVLLALAEWGYWALVIREIARSAIVTCGVWMRCLWLPGLPTRNTGTRSLIRFGGELSVAHLLSKLVAQLDKLLVGRFFGANALGMYRAAQQLLAPVEQLDGPIVGVGQPALSVLQAEPERYRRFYEKVVFLVGALTIPLGFFPAVCADEVTALLLGPAWADATLFVGIFGVMAAVRPVLGTSAMVLVTCGRSTRYLVLTIVYSVVSASLMMIGLNWGAAGIALAHVVVTLLLLYPDLYYSFLGTRITVRVFFRTVRAPLLAGGAMSAGLAGLKQLEWTDTAAGSLLLSAAVGVSLYVVALWVQPLGQGQIKALWDDVRGAVGIGGHPPAMDAS